MEIDLDLAFCSTHFFTIFTYNISLTSLSFKVNLHTEKLVERRVEKVPVKFKSF
jgi:hypothetical protein